MTQAVAHILEQAEHLSEVERAELADRLIDTLAHEIPPDIQRAHLDEVRRRIAEIESGEVTCIPGDEVLAKARRMVEAARCET